MSIKISINGFGRIGRAVFKRIIDNHSDLEVVAINDLTDVQTLKHLLKYDSVYGAYNKEIGKNIKILAEPEPAKLPWKNLGVDIVLECTGYFTDLQGAQKHIQAGAKKVIISANAKMDSANSPQDSDVPHFVLGVNEQNYEPKKHNIIANCSCTTNCAASVIKILNDNFGVLKGQMATIHAVTSTQNLVDGPNKDLRRARSAMANIIPTTTGAAKAVVRVLPELKGKISGSAFRVPVICGSILEIVAQIKQETTVKKINKVFIQESKNLKGILEVSNDSLVSSDIIGTTASAIVDLALTEVLDLPEVEDENLIKIVAWYDNEWAYACRLVELAEYIGKKI